MRMLSIGPDEKQLIAGLITFARVNVMRFAQTKRAAAASAQAKLEIQRSNSALTIHLPVDYQVTYTHEEQRPGVVCRHLSVSVKAHGKGPHPEAVRMIMQAFGFVNDLYDAKFWQEPLDDRRFAVNVLEPLDGDFTPLRGPVP